MNDIDTDISEEEADRELREAVERIMKGIRDPEIARRSAERMDRMREEVFRKHGVLDIGVPAIRELRDE